MSLFNGNPVSFGQDSVIPTHGLDSLQKEDPTMVLVYSDNDKSKEMLNSWNEAAKESTGTSFYAYNTSEKSQNRGPAKETFSREPPYVAIYYNGEAIGYYDGTSSMSFVDLSLLLASDPKSVIDSVPDITYGDSLTDDIASHRIIKDNIISPKMSKNISRYGSPDQPIGGKPSEYYKPTIKLVVEESFKILSSPEPTVFSGVRFDPPPYNVSSTNPSKSYRVV